MPFERRSDPSNLWISDGQTPATLEFMVDGLPVQRYHQQQCIKFNHFPVFIVQFQEE